jgi:hypothetical protein
LSSEESLSKFEQWIEHVRKVNKGARLLSLKTLGDRVGVSAYLMEELFLVFALDEQMLHHLK